MQVMAEAPSLRPSNTLGCPRQKATDQSFQTIERASGEEKGPRIAEPMVFDLIRPLGAKRGEERSICWVSSRYAKNHAG
jgi:hypothetical protein